MEKTFNNLAAIFTIISLSFFNFSAFAQNPPTSQTTGGIIKQKQQIQKERELEKEIKKKKEKPAESTAEEVVPEEEGRKVVIKDIRVEGVTLISLDRVEEIIKKYEGEEITFQTMQKIADLITDEYRKDGYVTSRAYIPPQTIKEGILIIRVLEGEVGSLSIEGNRYFKTSLLKKKLDLPSGEPFNYSKLQSSIIDLNEHPDRTVRMVLVPGKEQGTTDVVLKVDDNFPFHLGYEFDNYGSRYIEKDRFGVSVEHNNLLGFDDKLYYMYQISEYDYYELHTARYVIPVTNKLELGAYLVRSDIKLGREFEAVDSRGNAEVYGIFANQKLIVSEDLDLRFNLGFDYKDIKNYLLGSLDSHDELRVFKIGFDLDANDKWGRNIFTAEFNAGVPDIFGGMPAKSDNASRTGAGGKFYKGIFNFFRLQPAPLDTSVLLKNQAQYSNYNLPAVEQFQIGGPTSVRGYPVAEHTGDSGYYGSLEWSLPPYFVPKDWKVPFTEDNIYDTFRTVVFYDWGFVELNKPGTDEEEYETLKGWGFGFRLNLTNDISTRIEFGFPIGKEASDGHDYQHWVEVNIKF